MSYIFSVHWSETSNQSDRVQTYISIACQGPYFSPVTTGELEEIGVSFFNRTYICLHFFHNALATMKGVAPLLALGSISLALEALLGERPRQGEHLHVRNASIFVNVCFISR